MDIYLIRHTRVQSMDGICYGRSDVSLAPDFPEAALEVKRGLPLKESSRRECPRVYSSPSTRCRALAEFLSPGDFHIDAQLMEMDFGSWELQPWDAIPRRDIDAWAEDYLNVACPGGESLQGLRDRVLAFWNALVRRKIAEEGSEEDSDVLVVTHAGPIRVILAELGKIPVGDMFSIPIGFGDIRKITCRAGQAVLAGKQAPLLFR